MQIDIKNYLKQNLQRPKELDFTDEVIEYLVNLESEVSRYKNALEVAKTRIALYTDDDFVDDTLSAIDKVLKSADTITKDTKGGLDD